MSGRFITFEGGEGSGKTTQLKGLLATLRALDREVIETRDPGGTAIGNQMRGLLLDGENARMVPIAELLLYEASRAQLVREVIRPALAAGKIVLCDRFTDSTVAYQGYGRGLDLGLIDRLNDLAADGLRPHLTLLLDLDPAVGLVRVSERLTHPRPHRDRLEGERLEFHQRVRSGYRTIATQDPERVVVLDAMQGILEIEAQIRRRIEPLLAAGNGSAGSPPENG